MCLRFCLVVILSTAAFTNSAHANFSDLIFGAIDSTFDGVDHCFDVLMGDRPGPIQAARNRRDLRKYSEALEHALGKYQANRRDIKDAYAEAKREFLDGFTNASERKLAQIKLEILKPDNSDGQDVRAFQHLTAGFGSLDSTSFRNLALMLIRRTNLFQTSNDVTAGYKVITQAAEDRQLSSIDIALMQIEMIQVTDTFNMSGPVIEAFGVIFSQWAERIERDDFFAVLVATEEVINTFADKKSKDKAVEIIRQFALESFPQTSGLLK